jgi:uncharacterized membrane protein
MSEWRHSLLISRTGRIYGGIAVVIAIVTVIGLVVLWPGEAEPRLSEGLSAPTERAEVTRVAYAPCPPPQPGSCGEAEILLRSGPDEGRTSSLPLGSTLFDPELEVGDQLRVSPVAPVGPQGEAQAPPPGGEAVPAPPGGEAAPGTAASAYAFSDFERRSPLLWLALAFCALVIVFGRLRGALSLLGLIASLAVILFFVVPAILNGEPPLTVAIFGALAVMLLTISLAHGLGAVGLSAMMGTAASMLLVAILAQVFTSLTNLTGLASDEVTLLQVEGLEVSFHGLLLAGMVIGALGVLDDVTVSQSATVTALRRANPALGFGELYRRALEVGRDHVAATVNTLVLAYVGAALPVLLIFSSGDLGLVDAANVELIAQEIVATLVGSTGIIASVPITTALAALLARDLPAEELPAAHAHAH